MTAQELYQRRLAALRNPQQRGDASGLINMLAGGAPVDTTGPTSVPLDAEQGPAMGGGLLNKAGETATSRAPMGGGITAPGKTHFFIKGRGPAIDFGPIFKPRSTGVNPMTGDPFEATSGVGGFFRRLLGDNSDELNAEWQKMRMERQMGLADKAEERLAKAEELAAVQGFQEKENAAQRTFIGGESAADRAARLGITEKELASREKIADKEWTTRASLATEAQKHDKSMAEAERSAQFLRDASQFGYQTALQKLRNEGDLNEVISRGIYSGSGGAGGRGERVESYEPGKLYVDPKTNRTFEIVVDQNSGRMSRVFTDTGEKAGDELTADQRNLALAGMQRLKQAEASSNPPVVPLYGGVRPKPISAQTGVQSTTSGYKPTASGLPTSQPQPMTLDDFLKQRKTLVQLLAQ